MEYIDKADLVAEIESKKDEITFLNEFANGTKFGLETAIDVINSLEVTEVDLEVEQRMKECPYRQVGCTMYEGHILECRGACGWVVDYLNLKELKAQKGE